MKIDLILSSVEDFHFSLSFLCKILRFSEQKLPMWQKKKCQLFTYLTKSYSSQAFCVKVLLQMVFKWRCDHYSCPWIYFSAKIRKMTFFLFWLSCWPSQSQNVVKKICSCCCCVRRGWTKIWTIQWFCEILINVKIHTLKRRKPSKIEHKCFKENILYNYIWLILKKFL